VQKLLSYNYIYLIPLTASAIVSLRSFRLAWLKPYRNFSLFLITSLIMEIFAISWKWGLHQTALWSYPKSNLWIYNAFLTIQLLFYMSFYHRIFTSVTIRKIIRYSVLPVVCFGFLDYVWIQTPSVFLLYWPWYFFTRLCSKKRLSCFVPTQRCGYPWVHLFIFPAPSRSVFFSHTWSGKICRWLSLYLTSTWRSTR